MKVNSVIFQTYTKKCIGSKSVQSNSVQNFTPQKNTHLASVPLGVGAYGITFGYHSVLKDLFKEDKLPSVKFGLYGDKLTKENVSLEHAIPHSCKNGKSVLRNFALASKQKNNLRSNSDIRKFLTPDMALKYLKQFVGIEEVSKKGTKFNGNQYIEMFSNTLKTLGIDVTEDIKNYSKYLVQ